MKGVFRDEQKRNPRVKQAYTDTWANITDLLKRNSIELKNLRVFLCAFKTEKKLELWARNKEDKSYRLIREYNICQSSGSVGPKRMEGDMQVPEGFYHINHFNSNSNFYLSLGINYPNASDSKLGKKGKLGGAIYIHGSCVTIGCIPITDEYIKELYVICVEAKDNGQLQIPVFIFPEKLTELNYKTLINSDKTNTDKLGLWADLKTAFDYFEQHKDIPNVRFLSNGRHKIGND